LEASEPDAEAEKWKEDYKATQPPGGCPYNVKPPKENGSS